VYLVEDWNHHGKGHFDGEVILEHVQTCVRSIFSTLLARGRSDAASGCKYCSNLGICKRQMCGG